MIKQYGLVTLFLAVLVLFTSSCGNAVTTTSSSSSSSSSAPSSFTIAYQPGLSFSHPGCTETTENTGEAISSYRLSMEGGE